MSNYRVMLVDDEEDVIHAIIKKIKWEELGFEITGYAHNGLEALEMAETGHPDVVMTDIKMPYMSGLELSRQLKEQYPTIKIIIFSGFDEFEYAKEAIRLEAEEYILKPIDSDELSQVFQRIKESLDQEIAERRDVQKLQNYYMDSLPLLQENFYGALIEGRVPGEKIDSYIADYQIQLSGPSFAIAVIHASTSSLPENISPVMMSVSLKNFAMEKMTKDWDPKFFSYHENTVMIASLPDKDMTRFTNDCDRFCRAAQRVLGTTVTIGIGRPVDKVNELSKSYAGAKDAVSYRVIYGTGHAINIAEIAPMEKETSISDEEALRHDVYKQIRLGTESSLESAADKYMDLALGSRNSIDKYNLFVMELISELYRFANKNQLEIEAFFGNMSDIYVRIQQMETTRLKGWFIDMCKKLQKGIQQGRSDSTRSFVRKAADYVQDNYDDPDLNIDKICNILGVSSAYFSTVFKKEMGTTFVSYLTDYRMERAMELLTETSFKTYVIAEKVGYLDANYFSYVFKKQYGSTPSKYRAELKQA